MNQIHGFIDSHCHLLNMQERNPDLLGLMSKDLESGKLWRCIDIGTGMADLTERLSLMKQFGIEHFTLGLYPSHANAPDLDHQLAELEAKANFFQAQGKTDTYPGPKLIAIGEIGIDQFWNYAPVDRQLDLLTAQIKLANQLNLPVVIHNREADQAIIQCFTHTPPIRGGILHCFSADYGFARQLVDFGFLVSFAGNLTYKNSQAIQDAAKRLPLQVLACETDSPYLSPVPMRGKPNYPGNVQLVYEFLSLLKGITVADCANQINANLAGLLNW